MSTERPFKRGAQLIVGRLVEHGRANYEFRADQDPSYYLKIQTNRGERILWGKDIERALSDGQTQPKTGDLVGARRVSREAITPTGPSQQGAGARPSTWHRTRWEVEKAGFFADRARRARVVRDAQTDAKEAVQKHPELKSTFLSLRSAEQIAAQRIANPKDREKFLELVREAMAGSIHRGEPLPEVRIREASKPKSAPAQSPPSKQDDGPVR